MENSKSISVVIPNFNGRALLEKNIPMLLTALQTSGAAYEVIVVDDASTDDSVAFLRKEFPTLSVIVSDKNQGFSVTINKGIRIAQKELVFLLNSDVSLQEDYFESQFKYFELPDTFGVMGRIVSEEGGRIQDAAKFPEWRTTQINATKNFLIQSPGDFKVPTFFLSGANALVDRKKIQFLQGMDEVYSPFYYEDVDLGIRAWRMNWRCYYEHQAICFHPLSVTIGKYHKRKRVKIIAKRNKLILHAIHLQGMRKLAWEAECMAQFLTRWLLLDGSWYKSFFLFLKSAAGIRSSREQLRQQFVFNGKQQSLDNVVSSIRKEIEAFPKKCF